MIFSTKTILESQNKTIQETNITLQNDKSLFFESLDLILQESISFNTILSVGKKILSTVNFSDMIKRILKWFANSLESLWKSFISILIGFERPSILINRYKNKLENIDISIPYNKSYVEYSNLGINTSYTSYKVNIENILNSMYRDLDSVRKCRSYNDLYNELNSIKNDRTNNNYVNEIRSEVLGTYDTVSKSEFASKLYSFFRKSTIEVTDISPEIVRLTLQNYLQYKSNLNMVEKDKKDLKNASSKIESELSSLNINEYINDSININNDIEREFNSIINSAISQTKDICEIYLQVFSAKLDAFKESRMQDTRILVIACQEIEKRG